ncbi:MAG: hydrogenase maturation protease [Aquificae bacterium]|nr:hydrogenase maturation protease [Aquificota bacterium]
MKTVIIGCGNPVRSDDGVGPRLIRLLWEKGVPPNVKLVDGGTSGIDVVYHMQGSDLAIFVDACYTGEGEPGTIYEVPAQEIEELPSREEANLHSIKWFHAIALAKFLLKEGYPKNIRVFLIEGKNFSVGEGLSAEVEEAVNYLARKLFEEVMEGKDRSVEVELTEEGYIKIPASIAKEKFSGSMSVLVLPRGMDFYIIPLPTDRQGGLILKRINSKGDRAVLVWELLPPGVKPGPKKAFWNEEEKSLVVSLL